MDTKSLIASRLGKEAGYAVLKLLELEYWPKIEQCGDSTLITVCETNAFKWELVLHGASGAPDCEIYWASERNIAYYEECGEFSLFGKFEDVINESEVEFDFRFKGAEARIEVYNSCDSLTYYQDPWDYLATISYGIAEKAKLPFGDLNEKEKALLPVIREVYALSSLWDVKNDDWVKFSSLISLAEKYGQKRVVKLLKRLEETPKDSRKYMSLVMKVTSILNTSACEPMWREIFTPIRESQKEYPIKSLSECPSELLYETRRKITERLHKAGYSGEYPDFYKVAPMKGIHLESSYNMTYFVGMQKKVTYRIRCTEYFDHGDALNVQFLCATDLSKNQSENDVYSCMFNSKGDKLYKNMNYRQVLNETEDDKSDDLDLAMAIVIKKTECLRLTKEEKQAYYGLQMPSWPRFLFWLIVGGFFAIVMIIVMLLFCVLVTVVLGFYKDIPEMLVSMPWGWLFLLAWIGIGGLMGLFQVLADRK